MKKIIIGLFFFLIISINSVVGPLDKKIFNFIAYEIQYPKMLVEILRDITALGSLSFFFIGLLIIIVFFPKKELKLQIPMSILMLFSKNFFMRARPLVETAHTKVFTSSFPSYHAFCSMFLILLIVERFISTKKTKALKYGLYALVGFVGISRVILKVHWPSDILGGWLLALIVYLSPKVYVTINRFSKTIGRKHN